MSAAVRLAPKALTAYADVSRFFAMVDDSSSLLVLVVDDDPAVRSSVCAVLESAGYRTITAGNGREAIAQLDARPKLVLTDMNMAGSSGLEVINAIRFGGVNIPVIAMSSWQPTGYDPLKIALTMGAARVLHKDRMDDLLSVIEEVIGAPMP
jgi:CheY-like chemotaxis protein